jgi:gamma-glutamyltranspeptidase/glutathione hydrolase
VPETAERLPRLRGLEEPERALALAAALDPAPPGGGHTTNLAVVDHAGNACVLTTSLGLGSGDFVPDLDLHLNSMLGETDLLRGPLEPGARMESMMAPTLALHARGLALAAGAAGGTRLRGALLQVVSGVLDEGLGLEEAVARPRLHVAEERAQLEPGFDERTAQALEGAGYEVRVWPAQHHYFGGVSAVTPSSAAGDPRRSGAAAILP